MPSFTRTATIERPAAAIFAVLDDLEQAKGWMPAIRKIEVLTPGQKVGVGFKWRETRRLFGVIPMRFVLTVTGHEPPNHWRILYNDGKVAVTAAFDLVSNGEVTEVTLTEDVEDLQGKVKHAETMLQRMEKQDGDLVDRLKAYVESTVPAGRGAASSGAAAENSGASGKTKPSKKAR